MLPAAGISGAASGCGWSPRLARSCQGSHLAAAPALCQAILLSLGCLSFFVEERSWACLTVSVDGPCVLVPVLRMARLGRSLLRQAILLSSASLFSSLEVPLCDGVSDGNCLLGNYGETKPTDPWTHPAKRWERGIHSFICSGAWLAGRCREWAST